MESTESTNEKSTFLNKVDSFLRTAQAALEHRLITCSRRSSRACAQALLKQPSASLERRSSRACGQTLLKPYPSEIEKITLKTIIEIR
ncbi:hypothetical protein BpHYR1_025375 [Brachionus plicatilis]|uniref:Uncharacterized protein n=1 Tax=Brachionus plicatilis TaxID=10195 RepID=A0A3M7PTN8_BRAPC|nr:hypothetical protein BpHYR1_025375 [Brachionus plicatilis]